MPGNTPPSTKPVTLGHTLVACCAIDPAGALVPNSGFNVASVAFAAGPGYTITFSNALPSATFYVRWWQTSGSFGGSQTKSTASLIIAAAADQISAGNRGFVEIWQ